MSSTGPLGGEHWLITLGGAVIAVLLGAVRHLYKKNTELSDARLADEKAHTTKLLELHEQNRAERNAMTSVLRTRSTGPCAPTTDSSENSKT